MCDLCSTLVGLKLFQRLRQCICYVITFVLSELPSGVEPASPVTAGYRYCLNSNLPYKRVQHTALQTAYCMSLIPTYLPYLHPEVLVPRV